MKGCVSMSKTLVVCLSDDNGMMFNNRRQSRDLKVTEKVLQMAERTKLWVSEYSVKLFPTGNIFQNFSKDGLYFIENPDLLTQDIIDEFKNIVVFRWNRDYPADKFFNFDIQYHEMIDCEEFEGNSHEKITMENYKKKG